MNAPDKIFVSCDPFGFMSAYATENHPPHVEEYIRKDALLEWAKSRKAKLKQGYKHEWKNDDILHGGTLILDSLIDEIKSL